MMSLHDSESFFEDGQHNTRSGAASVTIVKKVEAFVEVLLS